MDIFQPWSYVDWIDCLTQKKNSIHKESSPSPKHPPWSSRKSISRYNWGKAPPKEKMKGERIWVLNQKIWGALGFQPPLKQWV